jgi:hypothetical protein
VSLWVRDVEFVPNPRRSARRRAPNRLQVAKQAEIDALLEEGRQRVGRLSEREFLMAGAALYAGEGAKRDGEVAFPNSDPRMIDFFLAWFRHFFQVDEARATRAPLSSPRPRRRCCYPVLVAVDGRAPAPVHGALPARARPHDPPHQASSRMSVGSLLLHSRAP